MKERHELELCCCKCDGEMTLRTAFAASTNGRRNARAQYESAVRSGKWQTVTLSEVAGEVEWELESWELVLAPGASEGFVIEDL